MVLGRYLIVGYLDPRLRKELHSSLPAKCCVEGEAKHQGLAEVPSSLAKVGSLSWEVLHHSRLGEPGRNQRGRNKGFEAFKSRRLSLALNIG